MTDNTYTKKEKLLALELLGHAKQAVAMYAKPEDQSAGIETVLRMAAEYAKSGADYTVVSVLEYPTAVGAV